MEEIQKSHNEVIVILKSLFLVLIFRQIITPPIF